MKERYNSKAFLLIFLGTLTAFGPLVTDMYLPTLPEMTGYFSTSSSMVQLGLTASMIGLAAGQLLFGPVSDRYGRRPPLITAMILFLLSTLGCIFAHDIFQFVAWRLVQGVAGAGSIGMVAASVLLCTAMALGCGFWTYEILLIALLASLGLTFTASNTLAMDAGHDNAGTASALLGALGFAAGGIVSPLVGLGNIMSTTGIIFAAGSVCSYVCARRAASA